MREASPSMQLILMGVLAVVCAAFVTRVTGGLNLTLNQRFEFAVVAAAGAVD